MRQPKLEFGPFCDVKRIVAHLTQPVEYLPGCFSHASMAKSFTWAKAQETLEQVQYTQGLSGSDFKNVTFGLMYGAIKSMDAFDPAVMKNASGALKRSFKAEGYSVLFSKHVCTLCIDPKDDKHVVKVCVAAFAKPLMAPVIALIDDAGNEITMDTVIDFKMLFVKSILDYKQYLFFDDGRATTFQSMSRVHRKTHPEAKQVHNHFDDLNIKDRMACSITEDAGKIIFTAFKDGLAIPVDITQAAHFNDHVDSRKAAVMVNAVMDTMIETPPETGIMMLDHVLQRAGKSHLAQTMMEAFSESGSSGKLLQMDFGANEVRYLAG